MNLLKINHSELKELVKIYYHKKTPIFIYGGFGIGKSFVIKEVAVNIAKEKGKEFIDWNKINSKEKRTLINNTKGKFIFCDIRTTQIEPSDLRGLPLFNGDKDFVDWKPNLIFSLLSEKDADGILFFDEMNNASPMVMASLYQIFLDRAIGEISINKDVGIISAGNRIGVDKANVFEVPAPLKDRMGEVELSIPSVDEWIENFALPNNINGRIIAFLKFKSSYLYLVDDKNRDKSATPRGWSRANNLIDDVDNSNLDLLKNLVSSALGEGIGLEWVAYTKLQRKIDIEEYLKNPKKVNDLKDLDLRYALLGVASEYYKKHKKVEMLEKMLYLCEHLEAEYSVLLLRFLKGIDEKFFKEEIVKLKVFNSLSKNFAKYLL